MAKIIKQSESRKLSEHQEAFVNRVQEKVKLMKEYTAACKLESEIAAQKKKNDELNNRLKKLNKRYNNMKRVCDSYKDGMITSNDLKRLETCKMNYHVIKEMTGLRLDFKTPPHIVKGYFKDVHRKLIQPFEINLLTDKADLWNTLEALVRCDEESCFK